MVVVHRKHAVDGEVLARALERGPAFGILDNAILYDAAEIEPLLPMRARIAAHRELKRRGVVRRLPGSEWATSTRFLDLRSHITNCRALRCKICGGK